MKLSRKAFIGGALFTTGGLALAADALWLERFLIETNEFELGEKKAGQPVKLVQVSDMHLNKINFPIRSLAEKLNRINPDLILFTGDSIDKADNLPLFNEFLKRINREIPKVAITGNWEYWSRVSITDLRKVYENHNGTLLINETRQYKLGNKTISITGVDDFVGGKADIETAVSNFTPSDHHIILNHCPQYTDAIRQKLPEQVAVDLILSGHTHGGQINILGYRPFLPQGSGNYIKGWYKEQNPPMYVSKGIGTSIHAIRFGSRSEIGIFDLYS